MYAAFNVDPKVIAVLVAAGAHVNDRSVEGFTTLMIAADCCENPEVILALLEAGADGKLKSGEGKTAFDYANDNEIIKGTNVYWLLNDARF